MGIGSGPTRFEPISTRPEWRRSGGGEGGARRLDRPNWGGRRPQEEEEEDGEDLVSTSVLLGFCSFSVSSLSLHGQLSPSFLPSFLPCPFILLIVFISFPLPRQPSSFLPSSVFPYFSTSLCVFYRRHPRRRAPGRSGSRWRWRWRTFLRPVVFLPTGKALSGMTVRGKR